MAFASEERRVASREMMATLENFCWAKCLLIARPRPGPEPIRRRVGVDILCFVGAIVRGVRDEGSKSG